MLEISGEVADQIIKSARNFSTQRHVRDAKVRDGVRDRDAAKINEAVLTIVADNAERMSELRKNSSAATDLRELDHVIELVDWGVRTFGSYVGTFYDSLCYSKSLNTSQVGSISTSPSHQRPCHCCLTSLLTLHYRSDWQRHLPYSVLSQKA